MVRILLVDDDSDFLKAASTLIKSRGYVCLTAEDRTQAIAIIKDERPDCCFVDVRLSRDNWNISEFDGVQVFEDAKQSAPRVCVYLVSAYTDYEEDYLMRRGARGLVEKDKFADLLDDLVSAALRPQILLVDDETEFADAGAKRLRSKGVECVVVTDKSDLMQRIAECDFLAFDAVILDFLLDEDKGFHAIQILEALSAFNEKHNIFLITGRTKEELEGQLKDLVKEFKPTQDRETLLRVMSETIGVNFLVKDEEPGWEYAVLEACGSRNND